jgi:hypothetical protein
VSEYIKCKWLCIVAKHMDISSTSLALTYAR